MVTRKATIVVLLALAAAAAQAQWAWKDDNGRMVYSDQPPPAGIKQSAITRQPTAMTPVAPSAAAPSEAAPQQQASAAPNAAADPNKPKSLADQELDFKKRQQARQDAEKKAADDQAKASAQAADCSRAKGYIQSLENGVRITKTDPDGNPHFLDDSERAAELDRTKAIAAKTCAS